MVDLAGEPEGRNVSEYIVVYRARSAARFFPNEFFELTVASPHFPLGPIRLRSFTSWVGEEPLALPRELIVEARGPAASLDDAVTTFSAVARPVATMAAFVANVRVGPLDVHLAYDCGPTKSERPFMEAFVPDERGGVSSGRRIRPHLMTPASTAFYRAHGGLGESGSRTAAVRAGPARVVPGRRVARPLAPLDRVREPH